MALVSPERLEQSLASLPGWHRQDKTIVQDFNFRDFKEAMKFVNRIADAAEAADHHPDIDIRYNKVRLALWSHDSGGVTERDLKMAAKINEVASS